ncbi:MAG: hypothetical protein HY738_09230, partial [Bacteroidia bacterium]|nr:hypothetical protein [Bacteroidia bacterium]
YQYTKETNAIYPLVDICVPLYVVTSVTSDNGCGNNITIIYKYTGAKLHRQGKGFLGFEEITALNNSTQKKVIKTYDINSIYYYSYLKETQVKTNTDIPIYTVFNTVTPRGNIDEKPYFSYLSQQDITDDLKNISSTTTYVYDDYGNLTEKFEDYGEDGTISSNSHYTTAGAWCPALPDTITVTRVVGE